MNKIVFTIIFIMILSFTVYTENISDVFDLTIDYSDVFSKEQVYKGLIWIDKKPLDFTESIVYNEKNQEVIISGKYGKGDNYKQKVENEIKTIKIESVINDILKNYIANNYWLETEYRPNYTAPKYIIYWIKLSSDKDKIRLESENDLLIKLRNLLNEYNYPISAGNNIFIRFISLETLDQEERNRSIDHCR